MKDFLKNKLVTILVVVATLILAGVAIFTAVRLYQLRTTPVAPTAPVSEPEARQGEKPQACQELTFNITTPTPTESISPTPTESTTPTPTTTLTSTPTPTKSPTPTLSGTPTPTSSISSTLTPTNDPELPDAGVGLPTIFAGTIGIVLITLSLMLAL